MPCSLEWLQQRGNLGPDLGGCQPKGRRGWGQDEGTGKTWGLLGIQRDCEGEGVESLDSPKEERDEAAETGLGADAL